MGWGKLSTKLANLTITRLQRVAPAPPPADLTEFVLFSSKLCLLITILPTVVVEYKDTMKTTFDFIFDIKMLCIMETNKHKSQAKLFIKKLLFDYLFNCNSEKAC